MSSEDDFYDDAAIAKEFSHSSMVSLPLSKFGRIIEGNLHIRELHLIGNVNNFVLTIGGKRKVELVLYFGGGFYTSILGAELELVPGQDGYDLNLASPPQHAESGFQIHYKNERIGTVVAALPEPFCEKCQSYNQLPMLMIKLLAPQLDGTSKLLGCYLYNVFRGEERDCRLVTLANVPLSAFMHGGEKQAEMAGASISSYVPAVSLPGYHLMQYSRAEELEKELGLLVLLDEIEADRPFSKIYTGEEAGIIAPIVGCDKWILPRSVFYGCVGRSIECTPGWVLCMLDFQFTLHGLPLESLHNEIEHEFDIKENERPAAMIRKFSEKLTHTNALKLWSRIMSIIVNGITLFVSTMNLYSLDKYDIECHQENGTILRTSLDNERNTIYCMLVERTYDCEDGAGLSVVLYKRILKCLSGSMWPLDVPIEVVKSLRLLHLMMLQYEPFSAVMNTSVLSGDDEGDSETFAHVGAVLIPKRFVEDHVFNAQNWDISDVDELHLVRHAYLKDDRDLWVKEKRLGCLMMESTCPMYADGFQSLLHEDATDEFAAHMRQSTKNIRKPIVIPHKNNISKTMDSDLKVYDQILALHPFPGEANAYHTNAFTLYIKNGDESFISFSELCKKVLSAENAPELSFFYKYVVPDKVLKEGMMYMKAISPLILLDASYADYKESHQHMASKTKDKNIFHGKLVSKGKHEGIPYHPKDHRIPNDLIMVTLGKKEQ